MRIVGDKKEDVFAKYMKREVDVRKMESLSCLRGFE